MVMNRVLKNTALWICATFALIYLMLGLRMADTLVYDYDGLLFRTDTAEVAEDITEFQTRNHGDTNVHPLYVLFVNPLGSFLHSFLPVTTSVILVNTLLGTLMVWLAYLFFLKIGLPRYQVLLWTILTGCTASNLLFVSIPERHIAAACSVTLMCLICVKYPGRIWRFTWGGIATIGVTVTNFAQCCVLYFFSLFRRKQDPAEKPVPWLRKTTCFVLITLAAAVVLSLIQKWIWPDTRLFFIPDIYAEEVEFMRLPGNASAAIRRLFELLTNMFVFNIAAPMPLLDPDDKFVPLRLGLESLSSYSLLGWLALSGWMLLIILSFYLIIIRRHGQYGWFQAGILVCLLFNLAIHMVYGDDYFLYTVNWTFPLLAIVASSLAAANKSKVMRLTVNTLMTLMVTAVVFNNAIFINDISSYFRYGGSMKWQQWQGKKWELAKEMEKFLVKEEIHTLFSGDGQKWIAYALNKRISVVNIPNEKSPKLKQQAELLSGNYAFLYDVGDVVPFIRNTLGSYKTKSYDEYDFYYDIVPPLQDLAPIKGDDIASISASCDMDSAPQTMDLDLDTCWTGRNGAETNDWLHFSLRNEQQVSCIRILSRRGRYPMRWYVETKNGVTGTWQKATGDMDCPGYFWSGPRLFWNGRQFHLEARFLPALITDIRIVFPGNDENRPPVISECLIYGPGEPMPMQTTALPILVEELREKKVDTLYSERWVANAVHAKTAGAIRTLLEPYIFEHERSRRQPRITNIPYPVRLTPGTAFLTTSENADFTRRCFRHRGLEVRETTVGPWVLFDFRDSQWKKENTGHARMYWAGISCFLARGNSITREELGKEARLVLDPPIKFGKTVKLAGISVEQADDRIKLRYFWEYRPVADNGNHFAVFVHFQHDGQTVFQGDHDLCSACSGEELIHQRANRIFVEQLEHVIPPHAPSGEYRVFMGIYDKQRNKRLKPITELSQDDNGVTLPLKITVTE